MAKSLLLVIALAVSIGSAAAAVAPSEQQLIKWSAPALEQVAQLESDGERLRRAVAIASRDIGEERRSATSTSSKKRLKKKLKKWAPVKKVINYKERVKTGWKLYKWYAVIRQKIERLLEWVGGIFGVQKEGKKALVLEKARDDRESIEVLLRTHAVRAGHAR